MNAWSIPSRLQQHPRTVTTMTHAVPAGPRAREKKISWPMQQGQHTPNAKMKRVQHRKLNQVYTNKQARHRSRLANRNTHTKVPHPAAKTNAQLTKQQCKLLKAFWARERKRRTGDGAVTGLQKYTLRNGSDNNGPVGWRAIAVAVALCRTHTAWCVRLGCWHGR